ncbi:MAG: hypothetical protein WB988_06295 [Candidatus Nitrosopolaris sp.]
MVDSDRYTVNKVLARKITKEDVPIEQEIESPSCLTLHSERIRYTFNGLSATDLLRKKEGGKSGCVGNFRQLHPYNPYYPYQCYSLIKINVSMGGMVRII